MAGEDARGGGGGDDPRAVSHRYSRRARGVTDDGEHGYGAAPLSEDTDVAARHESSSCLPRDSGGRSLLAEEAV